VDDFVLVDKNKGKLLQAIKLSKNYLEKKLELDLHPKKIYLQHYSKGIDFLGFIIKPYRIYVRNRTKGWLYKRIQKWSSIKINPQRLNLFISCINSYLGSLKRYNTYKLRKKSLFLLSGNFLKYVDYLKDCNKIFLKNYRFLRNEKYLRH
jgi:hypothetical protein